MNVLVFGDNESCCADGEKRKGWDADRDGRAEVCLDDGLHYWPAASWRTTSPGRVGIDETVLRSIASRRGSGTFAWGVRLRRTHGACACGVLMARSLTLAYGKCTPRGPCAP